MPRIVSAEEGERHVPIYLWGRIVPNGALKQLRTIASQPYVVEHVAAMPDLHVAHGVAVGTVFATDGTVVPSALGGDIGCGMSAIRFEYLASRLSVSDLQQLLGKLTRAIPIGDATHRGKGLAVPIYVDSDDGDRVTGDERARLAEVGITLSLSDPFPDLIFFDRKTRRLWCVEAITSDGEVDEHKAKGVSLLCERSGCVLAGLTTAYSTRKDWLRRQERHQNLAINTFVWTANDPRIQYRIVPPPR